MAAAVTHAFLERLTPAVAAFFLAAAMIAMLHAGMNMQKENDG
jgi:preprotein translocase subunit SecG